MIGALTALGLQAWRPRHGVLPALLALVFAACAIAQVEAARDSAEMFRVSATEQQIFAWLNANSTTGAVVATDNLGLSILLPVSTRDSVLFSNGSRSTASDQELMERFLLASRLSGASPERVSNELSSDSSEGIGIATYAYYLFETSPYRDGGTQHIASAQLPGLLQQFRSMNLEYELRRFRVDYLWTEDGRYPAEVVGWRWSPVLASQGGRLWQLVRE
jgi:hypothetical protein